MKINNSSISKRKAKKEDANLIARALSMAFGEQCSKALCGDDYLSVFEEIASCEDSQYSFRNALIAEYEGKAAGVICGYDGARLEELKHKSLEIIKKRTGKEVFVEKETGEGEFYIDSLGVLPEYRGQGLGKELLQEMTEQAFEQGHSLVGLLVDYNNPKAEALYEKLGFKKMETVDFLGHKMWHMQIQDEKPEE